MRWTRDEDCIYDEADIVVVRCPRGGAAAWDTNAPLIAAAPQMLEALEAVERWNKKPFLSWNEVLVVIREAIAAARPEPPKCGECGRPL